MKDKKQQKFLWKFVRLFFSIVHTAVPWFLWSQILLLLFTQFHLLRLLLDNWKHVCSFSLSFFLLKQSLKKKIYVPNWIPSLSPFLLPLTSTLPIPHSFLKGGGLPWGISKVCHITWCRTKIIFLVSRLSNASLHRYWDLKHQCIH